MLHLIKRIQSQSSSVTSHLSKTISTPVLNPSSLHGTTKRAVLPPGMWCLRLGNGAIEIVNEDGSAFLFYRSRRGYFRGCRLTVLGDVLNLGRVPIQEGAIILKDDAACLVINPDGTRVRFSEDGSYEVPTSAA